VTEFEFEKNEILTNLTLLEDHANKFQCPYCMEKHLSKIVGYAEEIAMGGEDVTQMKKLAETARKWRREIQGAKQHTHANPKRLYEPYGLTAKEKAAKARVKGRCKPTSRNLYCRLVRCIRKVEKKGGVKSPVAVCRAKVK